MIEDEDDDPLEPDDEKGSDTDIRFQGDRETHCSDAGQTTAPLPFRSGQLCGDFQLQRLLGRGSSGAVFRALDTVSRRSCALKILIGSDEQDLRRDRIGFRRMMGLRHPNLVRVDQLHRLDGYVALSMEEVHGETLAKTRRRFRKLDSHIALNKLLSLTRDYAAALAAMHSRGLLHRDIKPSNLMVDRNDVGRVIDYGLVGTFDAEIDSRCYRDYIAGTLRYIAPEAYFDQHYTPAGDIFSLGLVILEMLNSITGSKDLNRDKENKSQDALLISSAVDELSDQIPEVLRDGCLEMLQVRIGDRSTAAQVARLGLPAGKNTIYLGGRPLFGREKDFQIVCDWLTQIYDGGQGRFHLCGDSGIGKTELIDAAERHLRSLRWGQVFRARCRPRDNQPMQAIDQFADQIASRYSSNDRHPLLVDPVSAEILHQAFPVLKTVVKPSTRLPRARTGNERVDGLQAAVNLTVQLRKVGPLILIVDDVQWADIDSNAVLDKLQSAGGGMLGIITVSRQPHSDQMLPPDKRLKLKPLSFNIGLRMLRESADRWSVNMGDREIAELAEAAAGNPFRLGELADEFRPGGLLHSNGPESDRSMSRIGDLDQLCQHRVARLSDEARRLLPLIVTADCAVSINQLEMLTGMGDVIEIAVSELVNQRLVMDDATGGCCVQLIHDRVSDGVIAKLGRSEYRNANIAWAELLQAELNADDWLENSSTASQSESPAHSPPEELESDSIRRSGRIARHLIDSGNSSEALPFAKLAATECESAYAFAEAGEWHQKVAAMDASEEFQHLQDAARLFILGDKPILAANCFQRLAELSDGDNDSRLRFELESARLLIQSGRFKQLRDLLNQISPQLGLPKVDATIPWLSVATRNLRIVRGELFRALSVPAAVENTPASPEATQRIDFSRSIIRPLFFFNGPYAAELYWIVAEHTQQFGSSEQRIGLAIASASFACCDSGARRNRGQNLLREIQAAAVDASPRMAGEFWLAKSLSNAFAMDWQSIETNVRSAVTCYRSHGTACRSEEAHCQWLNLWAKWHLGQWDQMPSLRDRLMEDALRRDDRLTHFVASSGLAAAGWLIEDDIQSLNQTVKFNDEHFAHAGYISQFFRFQRQVLQFLYAGELKAAYEFWKNFDMQLLKSHLSRIQLARVFAHQFGALIALHLARSTGQQNWLSIAKRQNDKVRAERLPYAVAVAALFDGIHSSLTGDQQTSRNHLVAAQQLAKELKLRPIELAAKDQLHFLESGQWQGFLCHRMQTCDVKEPEWLERLYTVAMPD